MSRLTAALLLAASLGVTVWSFSGIVRRYRTLRGFPWLLSLAMAAASVAGLFAIYALLHP